jgi:hypothetical protein
MDEKQVPAPGAVVVDAGALEKARALLETNVALVVSTMMRGILVGAPGMPVHELLNAIAKVTGKTMSSVLVADLATTIQLRKGFIEAFTVGVRSIPAQLPQSMMQQNGGLRDSAAAVKHNG